MAASLVTALIAALITGQWPAAEWTTLVIGVLTSYLVWLVKNSDEGTAGAQRGPPGHHRV